MERDFLADNEFAHIYISALYRTKEYGKAFAAVQEAKELGVSSQDLSNLEAGLAEYYGDIKQAISIQEEIVKSDPDNIHHQIQIARLKFRDGKRSEALKILDVIDIDKVDNPTDFNACCATVPLF